MIDGIFNERLNRQRRDKELRSLYVVFYVKIVVITYFFEGKIRLKMLQLIGKRDHLRLLDGIEISTQILGKVTDRLFCRLGLYVTQAINRGQSVVQKMRLNLGEYQRVIALFQSQFCLSDLFFFF